MLQFIRITIRNNNIRNSINRLNGYKINQKRFKVKYYFNCEKWNWNLRNLKIRVIINKIINTDIKMKKYFLLFTHTCLSNNLV
jgi:hypothetical protein